MRKLQVFLILGLSASSLFAGFKIPKTVYRYDKLAEAVQKAEENKKALAFVYTDESST